MAQEGKLFRARQQISVAPLSMPQSRTNTRTDRMVSGTGQGDEYINRYFSAYRTTRLRYVQSRPRITVVLTVVEPTSPFSFLPRP